MPEIGAGGGDRCVENVQEFVKLGNDEEMSDERNGGSGL